MHCQAIIHDPSVYSRSWARRNTKSTESTRCYMLVPGTFFVLLELVTVVLPAPPPPSSPLSLPLWVFFLQTCIRGILLLQISGVRDVVAVYPMADRLCFYYVVILSSVLFPSLLFTCNFLGVCFFSCSLKDLRHSPCYCSFLRAPSFRLFPVCTQRVSVTPRLLRFFPRSFLPLFHVWSLFLCVEYLLADTGYM